MRLPRPGLAKVRVIPMLGVRRVTLVGMAAPRIAELVESADVVSEGNEVEAARGRRTYYGSTSFVLALSTVETTSRELLAAIAGDLHLRTLVVRRARAEASARASGPVGTARAEVVMRHVDGAIQIVVDLEVAVVRAARAQR